MMAKKINRKEFLKLAVGGLAAATTAGLPKFLTGQGQPQNPGQDYPGQNHHQNVKNKQTEAVAADASDNKFARDIELGKIGIRVSTIGFGVSRTMEPALVEAALGAGINFMDTGRSYFRGQNEVMVGKALGPRRKEVIIQSKLRVNLSPDQLQSAENISRALT